MRHDILNLLQPAIGVCGIKPQAIQLGHSGGLFKRRNQALINAMSLGL
jgi:hypothetical protein